MIRKSAAAIALVVLTVLCLAGCGKTARDVSTPSQALLGSWKPLSTGAAYIYFSPDTATYVPSGSGKSISVHYRVTEEDLEHFSVRIRYGAEDTGSEPFLVEFSEDRNHLYIYPVSSPEVLEYSYLNDRQEP